MIRLQIHFITFLSILFFFTDLSAQWIPINNGLTNLYVRSIVVDHSNNNILYVGTGGGGVFKSLDSGNSWSPINSGLTILSNGDIVVNPIDLNILYTGTNGGGIHKTTNAGNTWFQINIGLPTLNVPAIAVQPQDTSILYSGPDGWGIYRSTNGGNSWSPSGGGRDVRAFAIDPATPSTAYASTTFSILKTTDNGVSWFFSGSGLPSPYINGLAIDPLNTSTLYCGPSQSAVWKSTDGGNSWFAANNGIPAGETVLAIAIDYTDSNIIYAGTDVLGVFKSTDGGNNWVSFNDGLTDLNVGRNTLTIDPINPNTVYVGTNGGGIFKFNSDSIIFTKIVTGDIVNDSSRSFGSSWGDYDNDGDLDLFVANWNLENNLLYQNIGAGIFNKITTGDIVNDGGYSTSSNWGDYDNDGNLDLFVTNSNSQNNFLYQNNGDGTFTKITTDVIVNDGGESFGSSCGDYDNDGDLDLFVANRGESNFLYQNNGDGSFTKITTGAIVNDVTSSQGCSWGDYDNDGDLDLFVANRGESNFLYQNNGDGSFTKITTGTIVNDFGFSVGSSWGDYDNDGDLDLFVTNTASGNIAENNFLYQNNGNSTFTKITTGVIVNDGGFSINSTWGDYDNDGYLDLFVSNSGVFPNYTEINFLYHNNGDGSFSRVTFGSIANDDAGSYGSSWGDYDNDGDLDLFVANYIGSNNFLYRNNGSNNHWINIHCIGAVSNSSAIGTKVRIKANTTGSPFWQMLEISGQTGWGSQNSLSAEFGLRNATLIDSIKVEWPSGIFQVLENVNVNQFLTILEPGASITITSPNGGENWEVGSQHDITWSSNNISQINIIYTTDNGNIWNSIASNINATNGSYTWTIPNVTSNLCKIKINDSSNPNIFAESPNFTLRGWILARLNNGVYEDYRVDEDGWQFRNNSLANMWPESWWGGNPPRFDYTQPPYPPAWPFWPINARSYDFPDWPNFVDAFGEDQTYWNPPPGLIVYNPFAVRRWTQIKETWGGSCFGFAVSSFLAFNDKQSFLNEFPNFGTFNDLHEIPIDSEPRKVINQLWIYQFGENQFAHINANVHNTPNQTLSELKQMFLSNLRDDRFLAFYNQNGSGGHAVNPYRIEKDQNNPDLEYIYVYDNNFPDSNNQIVTINISANTWDYPWLLNWGGSEGFFLMDPVSDYLNTPILPKQEVPEERLSSESSILNYFVQFYNSPTLSINISNQIGHVIGYDDSLTFNTFQEGFPIIPITGNFHPPIGFYLPDDDYLIQTEKYLDSLFSFSVSHDSIIFSYYRPDADSSQTDFFSYSSLSNYFSTWNPDNSSKNFKISTIVVEDSLNKIFEIGNCMIFENDTLNFNILNNVNFQFINIGSIKFYDLLINLVDDSTDEYFEHTNIEISSNSTHQIVPNWDDLTNQPGQILIDVGNDGTIDDTLTVNNQYTGIEDEDPILSQVPKTYFLSQNFPNPFNLVTKIRFGLPKPVRVRIEVYNILGQKVATLVDDNKVAGYHEVELDASQLASGIYLYRIQAGDFHQVKKMVVMK